MPLLLSDMCTPVRALSAIGVADGVGGWASEGVDAGEYSRRLMALTRENLVASKDPCPLKALERAREYTQLLGSSTACVAVLYQGVLKTLNVGDSGFMVVKPRSKQAHTYDMVYRTKEQQHRFNMPFQLSFGPYSDKPSSGDAWEYKANPGDVVLMATDGVWDNLFDEEVMQALCSAKGDLKVAAHLIANLSIKKGLATSVRTPFNERHNQLFSDEKRTAGKLDDVTCVVSEVVEEEVASQDGPREGVNKEKEAATNNKMSGDDVNDMELIDSLRSAIMRTQ
ncbi:hypothetical protein GUITHDRAFT_147406 [Guillardia theta CCMP2712]|uniref:Protein phosphatase n=1 Tax=Guillardia theta (strain CCMP2712) TaxID=905079 RepID=L1IE95_GUITC|nr:hypothetical protein GUITHDRAFT_147406 [Guillardia theta CCMP2712]EKX34150.1 hypothetical protein GUITHDRAFT_147406 [Guillardia theta CCMP2712]|eukprot:XP_005821130.1 hypothetical protein GUITHDRAFT_147406 [Guillardia theta CCMP2712]